MTETHLTPRTSEPPEAAIRRLRALLDINIALGAVADMGHLLGTIIRTTRTVLRCEAASLLLHEPRENVLRFAAATGDPDGALTDMRVPLAGSLAGTIFRENRPLLAVDLEHDDRHFTAASQSTGLAARVLLGVPMRINGAPIGVLEAINPLEAFDAVDAEMLLIVSSQAAVALDRARQREALDDARSRLADLDRVKSDFMSVASHELRTPLAALRGFGEILHEEVRPELTGHADEVVRSALRMQSIVETLEEMSRLDVGDAPVGATLNALRDVLTSAAEHIERPIAFALPPHPISILGERPRLVLAFQHLLQNAATFTPRDGGIRVAARVEYGEVYLTIEDEGCGLAEQDLERIFEAFTQAEDPLTRQSEGMGMGLTLARSILLRHRGRVWATSSGPGQGSTFHVRLPMAD